MNKRIYRTESLCCATETNTTLKINKKKRKKINYTPIKFRNKQHFMMSKGLRINSQELVHNLK